MRNMRRVALFCAAPHRVVGSPRSRRVAQWHSSTQRISSGTVATIFRSPALEYPWHMIKDEVGNVDKVNTIDMQGTKEKIDKIDKTHKIDQISKIEQDR